MGHVIPRRLHACSSHQQYVGGVRWLHTHTRVCVWLACVTAAAVIGGAVLYLAKLEESIDLVEELRDDKVCSSSDLVGETLQVQLYALVRGRKVRRVPALGVSFWVASHSHAKVVACVHIVAGRDAV